jgi:hypothetical protein
VAQAALLERPSTEQEAAKKTVRASNVAATSVGSVPIPELSQLAPANQIVPFARRTNAEISALDIPAAVSVMPNGVPLQRDIEAVLREQIAQQRAVEEAQQPVEEPRAGMPTHYWRNKIGQEKQRALAANQNVNGSSSSIPAATSTDGPAYQMLAEQLAAQKNMTQAEKQEARSEQQQLSEAVR